MLPNQTATTPEVSREQVLAGMEQAAAMLSRFLDAGRRFRMDFNSDRERAGTEPGEEDLTGVCLHVSGAFSGSILLLASVENACRLAGLLLRRPAPADPEDEALRSTLREVGNIFASGVLGGLEDGLKLRALPSPPTFLFGTRQQVLEQCRQCCDRPVGLQIDAGLNCDSSDGIPIRGEVLFRLAAGFGPA
ncbi:MAG: hypothetical protein RQ754_10610 [Desulfuromonadales bacterium]|nr:hypothetical protein [Desulfuromonadales bacterium]